jgi:hypothetical protein
MLSIKLGCSINESGSNSLGRNRLKKMIVLDCWPRRSGKKFIGRKKKIVFGWKSRKRGKPAYFKQKKIVRVFRPRRSGKLPFVNKRQHLSCERCIRDQHLIALGLFLPMMLWQSVQQDNNTRQERQLLATEKLLKSNELDCNPRH